MTGGGRVAFSTLWWSSGRGSPRHLQSGAHWHRAGPGCPLCGPSLAVPGMFLSSLPPRPVCIHGHTEAHRPVLPQVPTLRRLACPSPHAPPSQTPQEKSLTLGAWDFLTFLFSPPLEESWVLNSI